MSKYVITIARQYGSGGRTIGTMLAERLGIPYYDKDILKLTSEESGVSEHLLTKMDENSKLLKTGGLFSKAKGVYDGTVLPPQNKNFTSDDNLFSLQAQTIKNLAEKESCIIIGRCSNYILKDNPQVLSVFIHADMDTRMERAKERKSLQELELFKFLEEDDKRKQKFCLRYTGKEWTDATSYDLCLNSGKLSYERCVDEIVAYLKIRFGEE